MSKQNSLINENCKLDLLFVLFTILYFLYVRDIYIDKFRHLEQSILYSYKLNLKSLKDLQTFASKNSLTILNDEKNLVYPLKLEFNQKFYYVEFSEFLVSNYGFILENKSYKRDLIVYCAFFLLFIIFKFFYIKKLKLDFSLFFMKKRIGSQAFFETNRKLVLTYFNEEFMRLVDTYDLDLLKKKKLSHFLDKNSQIKIDELVKTNSSIQDEELVALSKSGKKIPVELTLENYKNGFEDIYFGSFKDISSQKDKEKRVIYKQRTQAMGKLTSGFAHDFNNIIGSVKSNLKLLEIFLMEGEYESCKTIVADIDTLIENGSSIISKLLTFSSNKTIQRSNIDFLETVEESFNLTSLILKKIKNFKFIKTESASNININSDISLIHIIIQNLVLNSYHSIQKKKYSNEEFPSIELKAHTIEFEKDFDIPLDTIKKGKYCVISVTDNGLGIDNNSLDKIFQPYYTTKPFHEGDGLGLSIVWGVVKQHNGYIQVDSEVGLYTIFNIYIPVSNLKDIENFKKKDNILSLKWANNILFVDDNKHFLKSKKHYIEKVYGKNVVEFSSSLEALKHYTSNSSSYDLIITDMVMPELDGESFINKVFDINPSAKIIIITGYTESNTLSKLINKGVLGVIDKNSNLNELKS